MDNPIINEETQTTPQVISEEVKPKKSLVKPLLITLILLILLLIGGVIYLYLKNGADFLNVLDKGLIEKEETKNKEENLEEEEYKETESEKEENTLKSGMGVIEGGLSFPGEAIPSLRVCAVDTQSKKETCIQTDEGQLNYLLSVTPGTYFIYASGLDDNSLKAYYTACDTYPNSQEDPRCNSNSSEDRTDWHQEGFICYQDATCKAAFTPLAITVGDQQTVTLETIVQGWYIPCSHNIDVCNNPNFDVWSDYIK